MPTQIVVSIAPGSEVEFQEVYPKAKASADLVEIRLDSGYIPLRSFDNEPVILTGGDPFHSAALNPCMVDVPHNKREIIPSLKTAFPHVGVLGSYHNYEGIDIGSVIADLESADCIKVACHAQTALEALTLLMHLQNRQTQKPLTVIPMGDEVSFGRVVAAALGSHLSFCSLDGKKTALGQIDVEEMKNLYRVKNIDHLYGLIGSPVFRSLSYLTHNKVLQKLKVPAAYVKVDILSSDFEEVYPLLAQCGFKGLSVTTPFKERFGVDPINTIPANNTDGRAVADLLPEHCTHVLVIGAGGTAKAIISELNRRGCHVLVANRTPGKIVGSYLLEEIPRLLSQVQAVVHATSQRDFMITGLQPGQVVLDVIFPEKTPLLKYAESCGAIPISGLQMWIKQAAYQFEWWLGVDSTQVEEIIREAL